METNPIDQLAKDIAERLRSIEAKENEIEQIGAQIACKQDEIKKLAEEKRALEQLVQSERFIISERLGKPVKQDGAIPIKR